MSTFGRFGTRAPAVALIAALGLGGCTKGAAPAAKTPLLVGAVLPLTGPQATYGVAAQSGIRLALDAANKAGGIEGRPVEVRFVDDQSVSDQAVAGVERLVKKDAVSVIIGELSSGPSVAMAPLAERARTPMVSPSATAPDLTKQGPHVFRTCFADPFQAQAIARHAAEALGAKRVAVLRDLGATYSLELARAFESEAKRLGLQVVLVTELEPKDASFEAPLRKLAEAKPDVVYLPSYVETVRRVLTTTDELKLGLRFLGSDGWDTQALEGIGVAAEGHVFVSHFSPDEARPAVKDFVKAYHDRFNETPDAYAALGYDAARLVLDALTRAKSGDAAKITAALAATKGFEGATGRLDIDEGGDPKKEAVLLEIVNGRRKLVGRAR